jgi:signal transduction histidine kinase
VSVRDDGPGFAPERLAAAAAEGRLGVAQSIRGRIRELGGSAEFVSAPGEGTEVEMRVPRVEIEAGGAGGDARRGR